MLLLFKFTVRLKQKRSYTLEIYSMHASIFSLVFQDHSCAGAYTSCRARGGIYPGQVSKYLVYLIVTEASVHDLQIIMQLRSFSSAATKTKHTL